MKVLKRVDNMVYLEHGRVPKTIHHKIFRKYAQTGVPVFVEPYNSLVEAAYLNEISPKTFLEEFLRVYMT